jgi:hypothetical protein
VTPFSARPSRNKQRQEPAIPEDPKGDDHNMQTTFSIRNAEIRLGAGQTILPRRYYDPEYSRLALEDPTKISQPSLVPEEAMQAKLLPLSALKPRATTWNVMHKFGYDDV